MKQCCAEEHYTAQSCKWTTNLQSTRDLNPKVAADGQGTF